MINLVHLTYYPERNKVLLMRNSLFDFWWVDAIDNLKIHDIFWMKNLAGKNGFDKTMANLIETFYLNSFTWDERIWQPFFNNDFLMNIWEIDTSTEEEIMEMAYGEDEKLNI